MPKVFIPFREASNGTVPTPAKGSNIFPFSGANALIK